MTSLAESANLKRKDSTLSFVNSMIIIVCHLHFLTLVTQSYHHIVWFAKTFEIRIKPLM